MINILDKKDCTGCNACVQCCPKSCISMHEDEQGFLYPIVDLSKCIKCNLCERVCPVINKSEPRKPTSVYAAKNPDKRVRLSSSSGGVFFALAKKIINEGGVVFGARFNENCEVVHDYTETIEGLKSFQGSKYVQSNIGNNFKIAEIFLKKGRKVLFTGTPCQLAGLTLFLRKDYGCQLLKVDVVCHGVPSPMVWRDYLKYITQSDVAPRCPKTILSSTINNVPVISDISLRDKRLGWQRYGLCLSYIADENKSIATKQKTEFYEPLSKNMYLKGFLSNVFLRPSCYYCPSRDGRSNADISLADFWGIHKYNKKMYDPTGVSLLILWTSNGEEIINKLDLETQESTYDVALSVNPAISTDARQPLSYSDFWTEYQKNGIRALSEYLSQHRAPLKSRIINRIKDFINPIYFYIIKFTAK